MDRRPIPNETHCICCRRPMPVRCYFPGCGGDAEALCDYMEDECLPPCHRPFCCEHDVHRATGCDIYNCSNIDYCLEHAEQAEEETRLEYLQEIKYLEYIKPSA